MSKRINESTDQRITGLSTRSTLPEIMDAPGLPAADIHRALKELEIIGRRLGGYDVAIDALQRLRRSGKDVSTVMDLGSGGGDTLRAVSRHAVRRGYSISLTGIDRNPEMTAYAASLSTGYSGLHFATIDVFSEDLLQADRPHIVMSSLFCHHFDDPDLVLLLQRMLRLAKTAVVVNDLHRHPVAWHAIRLLTKLFSRSYMVKYDAPLSVARAFTRADWMRLLHTAGITNYTLRWRWAWRWQLIILKDGSHG